MTSNVNFRRVKMSQLSEESMRKIAHVSEILDRAMTDLERLFLAELIIEDLKEK